MCNMLTVSPQSKHTITTPQAHRVQTVFIDLRHFQSKRSALVYGTERFVYLSLNLLIQTKRTVLFLVLKKDFLKKEKHFITSALVKTAILSTAIRCTIKTYAISIENMTEEGKGHLPICIIL